MDIINELTNVYLKFETWHKKKLSKEESDFYHRTLMDNGHIFTYVSNNELLGYIEWWRINKEQLSRLVLNEDVLPLKEDIKGGEIAYINNMWITPTQRNGHVFTILANLFLEKNRDANFFVTFRGTKHNKPIQVYRKDDLTKFV